MQMLWSSKPVTMRLVALAAIAAVVLAGSLAFGAGALTTGAQSGGDIRGCVSSYTGALRILNGNQQCTTSERPLSWSKVPAGTVLDRQQVSEIMAVDSDDKQSTVMVRVGCPLGYQVVAGGGSSHRFTGSDRLYLKNSEPVFNGANNPQGWAVEFETVDGMHLEGEFDLVATALCELHSS